MGNNEQNKDMATASRLCLKRIVNRKHRMGPQGDSKAATNSGLVFLLGRGGV